MLADPVFVEITATETLEAVSKPVLSSVVLRIGGNTEMPPVIPLNPDPSPINLPNTVPAEIVEKNP